MILVVYLYIFNSIQKLKLKSNQSKKKCAADAVANHVVAVVVAINIVINTVTVTITVTIIVIITVIITVITIVIVVDVVADAETDVNVDVADIRALHMLKKHKQKYNFFLFFTQISYFFYKLRLFLKENSFNSNFRSKFIF